MPFTPLDIEVDSTTTGEARLLARCQIHVIRAAGLSPSRGAKLVHVHCRARLGENLATRIFSPGIVLSGVQVDLIPARILRHRQSHFGELSVGRVIRDHRLIAENQLFEMGSDGPRAASVFQGHFRLDIIQ